PLISHLVTYTTLFRSESLHDMQRFALRDPLDAARRSAGPNPTLIVVVGRIDDERVAFPMTARISVPELHARRQVRPDIQGNYPRSEEHTSELKSRVDL